MSGGFTLLQCLSLWGSSGEMFGRRWIGICVNVALTSSWSFWGHNFTRPGPLCARTWNSSLLNSIHLDLFLPIRLKSPAVILGRLLLFLLIYPPHTPSQWYACSSLLVLPSHRHFCAVNVAAGLRQLGIASQDGVCVSCAHCMTPSSRVAAATWRICEQFSWPVAQC